MSSPLCFNSFGILNSYNTKFWHLSTWILKLFNNFLMSPNDAATSQAVFPQSLPVTVTLTRIKQQYITVFTVGLHSLTYCKVFVIVIPVYFMCLILHHLPKCMRRLVSMTRKVRAPSSIGLSCSESNTAFWCWDAIVSRSTTLNLCDRYQCVKNACTATNLCVNKDALWSNKILYLSKTLEMK